MPVSPARGTGLLGGTFNPPHLGHLAAARHARAELGLERVLLMPAHASPHKLDDEHDPGVEARLQMCRLAVGAEPGLGVCAAEVGREGPSYTAETLALLRERNPSGELTFIVGADTASTLPTWREPRAVLELARLAVVARDGTHIEQVRRRLAPLLEQAGDAADVRYLEMRPVAVSSSAARAAAARGEQLAALVGEPVAAYIAEHRLYRDGGRPA
ncbi:MAG TPA: nicotinate (nicotinamide) nucleotide adenylyltransferase [Solirubrobacteraceae bacterium]|nr:nicotinate (nicotinamide) nucleotide adenylyltransferase [Solirubrobacteraceae bacterium]